MRCDAMNDLQHHKRETETGYKSVLGWKSAWLLEGEKRKGWLADHVF